MAHRLLKNRRADSSRLQNWNSVDLDLFLYPSELKAILIETWFWNFRTPISPLWQDVEVMFSTRIGDDYFGICHPQCADSPSELSCKLNSPSEVHLDLHTIRAFPDRKVYLRLLLVSGAKRVPTWEYNPASLTKVKIARLNLLNV